MKAERPFEFLDPGILEDGELSLTLTNKCSADPVRELVPEYRFDMLCGGKKAGNIRLRIGDTEKIYYGGHIGYEVEPEFRGRRFAGRSCRLLFPLAKAHGYKEICITCDPENTPSRRTIEGLNAKLDDIYTLPENNDMRNAGMTRVCRFIVPIEDTNK